VRIILTSVGGSLAPLLTKFLKKDNQLSNIYIVGIDRRKIKKILNLDAFYTVKMKNKNYFLKKFLQICKKEQIDLIIPGSDNEALIFSKFKTLPHFMQIILILQNKFCIKSSLCLRHNCLPSLFF